VAAVTVANAQFDQLASRWSRFHEPAWGMSVRSVTTSLCLTLTYIDNRRFGTLIADKRYTQQSELPALSTGGAQFVRTGAQYGREENELQGASGAK
jgi:hypothetical protein